MNGEPVVPSKWTDEIDEVVRTNWAVGISATDCANIIYARFGVMFSRNAIIGRCKRKGYQTGGVKDYPGRPKETVKPMHHNTEKKLTRRIVAQQFGVPIVPIAPIKPTQYCAEAPKSLAAPLLDLPRCGCRYATSPDDATTHLFCGAPQADGGPYCSHHARIAYRGTARQIENEVPTCT